LWVFRADRTPKIGLFRLLKNDFCNI